MKYIDADLLRKEVEKRMHICNGVFERDSDTYYQGKAVAYQETLSFIDSLQQEQPEWSEKNETSIAVKNPEAYKIGFADGEAYAKEQMQEWSEEDEKMLNNTLYSLKRYQLSMPNFQVELQMRWLKSLRPSWKPSEEQIVNATFNDLAEVYGRIRTEMLRRHRDIAINIKEGQQ